MSGANPNGADSNPLTGGSSANTPPTNPLTGGSAPQNPAPPNVGQPAGNTGSNPPAGGSSEPGTPQAVPPEVAAEWKRENAALRKRLEALEQEKKAGEDAKLTADERKDKQLAELQRKDYDNSLERQTWLLEKEIVSRAQQLRLNSVDATVTLLRAQYGDQLDYDERGKPVNAEAMLARLIEKNPWLQAPEQAPSQQQPNSGRVGSAPRTPTGQYAPKPPESVPPDKWPTLSDIQWSQPRGDLGTGGSNTRSGNNQ
jgi:hypothetical protein